MFVECKDKAIFFTFQNFCNFFYFFLFLSFFDIACKCSGTLRARVYIYYFFIGISQTYRENIYTLFFLYLLRK